LSIHFSDIFKSKTEELVLGISDERKNIENAIFTLDMKYSKLIQSQDSLTKNINDCAVSIKQIDYKIDNISINHKSKYIELDYGFVKVHESLSSQNSNGIKLLELIKEEFSLNKINNSQIKISADTIKASVESLQNSINEDRKE